MFWAKEQEKWCQGWNLRYRWHGLKLIPPWTVEHRLATSRLLGQTPRSQESVCMRQVSEAALREWVYLGRVQQSAELWIRTGIQQWSLSSCCFLGRLKELFCSQSHSSDRRPHEKEPWGRPLLRNTAEQHACPWGNQPQGWRTKGKCHGASHKRSPASCQKCDTQTHFLINVFISFVHDERSRGGKWEGLGSRGPWRDEPEANVLHSEKGSTDCSWEGKDGGDKNIPHSIYSYVHFTASSGKIISNICLNFANFKK